MSRLNKDVLTMIIEKIVFDKNQFNSTLTTVERKSIHSCLLVNRLWCETAVPILWKNPWKFVVRKEPLLNVLILFLSEESREFLASQGVYRFSKNVQQPPPPLFNYVAYCRYISFHGIDNCVYYTGLKSQVLQAYLVEQEVYKMLVSRCPATKFLDMTCCKPYVCELLTGNRLSLGYLSYLCCDSNTDPEFFYELANVCESIQKIRVNRCQTDNPGLARLIEVQRNLKCFTCLTDVVSEHDSRYKRIGDALTRQAHSLVHLKLTYDGKFFLPLEILPELVNLEKLKLINFDDHDYLLEEELEDSIFSNLQVFHIEVVSSLDVAIDIVEQTDGSLSEILLGSTLYDESDSTRYIQSIYTYCPNIEVLSVGINPDDYKDLEILLQKCQKLRGIVIDGALKITQINCGKTLLETLSRSAPKSLRDIRIFKDWKISANDLDLFLNSWRGRDSISLYFFAKNNNDTFNSFGKDFAIVLERYRMEGVVKDYRYDNCYQDFYFSW